MDVRAPGRYESFYQRIKADEGVEVLYGKVARIEEDPASADLTVEADSSLTGARIRRSVDLVVLATGMVPSNGLSGVGLPHDAYGFAFSDGQSDGIHPAGVAKRPMDVASSVRDGTAAALRAIQDLTRN